MKKKSIVIAVLISISLLACKKEYENIGTPSSKIEGVKSDWGLTKFTISDKSTVVEEKMDLTDFFSGNVITPNIKFSINGVDTTYTCDTTGLPYNVFGSIAGRWRFDNNETPTKLLLLPENNGDLVELTLLAPIRTVDNTLKVSKSVYCGGNVVFTYDLEFARRTN